MAGEEGNGADAPRGVTPAGPGEMQVYPVAFRLMAAVLGRVFGGHCDRVTTSNILLDFLNNSVNYVEVLDSSLKEQFLFKIVG